MPILSFRSVYFACSSSSCSVALDSPSAKCADPLMAVDPPDAPP
jgi:hypothetical protein